MNKIVFLLTLLSVVTFAQQKGTFTDPGDGKKYKTVRIGTQTWMAENLNYAANGSVCYDNNPKICRRYGRLYAWDSAEEVCPKGWHLPSDEEWQVLVDYAGGDKVAKDPRDGKKYKTVKIGAQTWMAENLNYAANGSVCYDNNPENCRRYGRLYAWATAMAACPNGWHLPSDKEWQMLVDYAGGDKVAGRKLKAKEGWAEDGNGTDDFGFSSFPGGYYSSGGFYGVGSYGDWWSSTQYEASLAYFRDMYVSNGNVRRYGFYKSLLYSVRCVQN